jgi:hypothetical protein
MAKITKIIESGGFCPFQLEAQTEDGRMIYLRYRGGLLRWGFVGKDRLTPDEYEFSAQIGGQYDGSADDKEFKAALKDSLEFPEGFSFEEDFQAEQKDDRE